MATTDVLADLPGLREAGSRIDQQAAPTNRLVEFINREKAAASAHVMAWRAEAERCYRFRDGHQLSAEDQAALQKAGRPDNAFNTAQKFIRFVTGVEHHTPEALIFEPVDETDEGMQTLGEVMTRYYDWAISKTYGDFERSRAFDDLVVAGMGWTDAFVSRDHDPKGLISMSRLPGNEMYWPQSNKQNLSDTRWRARESLVDRDEAIAMWPEQEHLIRFTHFSGVVAPRRPEAEKTIVYTVPHLETKPLSDYEAGSSEHNKVRILEFQWYDTKPGFYFYDPLEREDVWYEAEKFIEYRKRLAKVTGNDPTYQITDYLSQSQKVWQKVFLLNDRFQLGPELPLPGKRFTFNCMTGYYDEEQKVFYGYMRVLLDPQKFANRFFNQVIEIMGTQAKGGLIAEEGAIPPNKTELFEKNYSKPGSVSITAPNAVSGKKILPKPLPEMPTASIAIVEFCVKAMENVTGIDPETAFGQGSTNTPGITLRQKQKSGLLLLNQEFSSLSRFRIEEGYIMMDLLQTLADDRLIRVGKPYEGEVLRLMRAPFAAEYDLMLDDTERDPNIRHLYAETIMQLAPTLIRMNKFFPELLDYFPLPVKIRQAIKKAIVQTAEQEQQMAQQGIATHGRGTPVSPEERAAKVAKLKAETMAAMSKAARLQGQTQHDVKKVDLQQVETLLNVLTEASRMRIERDRQGAEAAQKLLDFRLDREKSALDLRKKQMEIEAKRQEARLKAAKPAE